MIQNTWKWEERRALPTTKVLFISPLACFLAGPVSRVVDITYKIVVLGYFPVDEVHGCWTKSKQNPVFAVSVSVVVSTLFVCT